jgi:hypothetical protein
VHGVNADNLIIALLDNLISRFINYNKIILESKSNQYIFNSERDLSKVYPLGNLHH